MSKINSSKTELKSLIVSSNKNPTKPSAYQSSAIIWGYRIKEIERKQIIVGAYLLSKLHLYWNLFPIKKP